LALFFFFGQALVFGLAASGQVVAGGLLCKAVAVSGLGGQCFGISEPGAGDLNLPEVERPRPLSLRLTNRYVDRLQTAAESDIDVAEQLLKITGFIDTPTRLLHPKMMLRAATANLHRRQRDSQPEQAGVAGRADDRTPLPEMLSE
jgi:hypothetical protein